MPYCCIEHHMNNDDALWCTACGSLVEGAMIGDYRLVSHIGNGSTADVYLAEQSSLRRRRVVIKILHRSCSEAHLSSFEREAAALASLSHPYILPIFSYGVLYKGPASQQEQAKQNNCLPYLVLPYAEQGSLAEIFERKGKRPWSLVRVVTIAKEVAEALDFAHAQGVIHRDVKPANILQMGTHALLCDFSVASLIDAEVSHLNASWAGSPAYMAPEVWQLHPGRYSDQYALAVTCFFLLTGQLPLSRSGDARTRSWSNLHCFVAPRSIRELRADLPLAIDVVLQRALSKDPHDRYATVQAFASDLFAASQDITQEIGAFPNKQEGGDRKVRPGHVILSGAKNLTLEPTRPAPAPIHQAPDTASPLPTQAANAIPASADAINRVPTAERKESEGALHPAPTQAGRNEQSVGARFIAPASVPREVGKIEDRHVQPVAPIVVGPHVPVTAPVSPLPPATPASPVADPKGFSIHDVETEALVGTRFIAPVHTGRWVWYALLLNFLVCLAVAAAYGWQAGDGTAAVNMLFAATPALLIGPLVARVFRRVTFSTLSWGLFWGVFFGLTEALLSILVCLIWTLLALLPTYYMCPNWCQPGNGFSVVGEKALSLTQQAVLPLVLGLWITVIGGAFIGLLHIRYPQA